MNSKIQIAVLLILHLLVFSSCSLFDPPANLNLSQQAGDEIIVESIDFNIHKKGSDSEWQYCKIQVVELSQYANVDSIIFTPNMRSQLETEHCIVELYNFDKSEPIHNSHVESTVRYTLHFGRSADMISTFPKEKTLIGFRFRSSKDGHYIEVGLGSRILIYSH